MKKDQRLVQVAVLSELIVALRLTELRAISQARDASLARLNDLRRTDDDPTLSPITAMEVSLRYERWADLRRQEINETLARQTATWLIAREAATVALGRTQTVKKLQAKVKP